VDGGWLVISWNETLSTGIDVIDDDHKFLTSLINQFAELAEHCEDLAQISIAVGALSEYVLNHFRREEILMMVCTYSERRQHQREHKAFTDIVDSLQQLYRLRPRLVNLREVAIFLSDWLNSHIAVSDQGYVAQMRAHKSLVDTVSTNLRDDVNFRFDEPDHLRVS